MEQKLASAFEDIRIKSAIKAGSAPHIRRGLEEQIKRQEGGSQKQEEK